MQKTKVLLLTQGVKDINGLQEGVRQATELARTIGFELEFDFAETTKRYTGTTFQNQVNQNGACIKPEEIGMELLRIQGERSREYNIGCVVFDWDLVSPKPTNPVQNYVVFDNATIIQIPLQWYSDLTVTPNKTFPEVFAQFFLHELCHAIYFFANEGGARLQDQTHNQHSYRSVAEPLRSWGNEQASTFYLHLMETLKQYWPLIQKDGTPNTFRVLKRGMSGDDVQALQTSLQKLGYFTLKSTTKFFGDITLSAVKRFQKDNSILDDGIVGAITLSKLKEKLSSVLDLTIIQKQTKNFFEGRRGYKPEAIVIHVMDGTLEGTDEWFASEKSRKSSHYGLNQATGKIHQYVKEEDAAWHAGVVCDPSWVFFKQGVNPNLYTIGIEHEGRANTVWSNAIKLSSAKLIKKICQKWSIPIDREHIIGHYQICNKKPNCPNVDKKIIQDLIDLARMI